MIVKVAVHPGSNRNRIGGCAGDDVLVVRVTAPALEDKANRAVAKALAKAFGVSRSAVILLAGSRSRTKVFEVEGADAGVLAALLKS